MHSTMIFLLRIRLDYLFSVKCRIASVLFICYKANIQPGRTSHAYKFEVYRIYWETMFSLVELQTAVIGGKPSWTNGGERTGGEAS
jgi:hypothetical protein